LSEGGGGATPGSFFEERLSLIEEGTYSVITNEEDARYAAAALRDDSRASGKPISWDVESVGKMGNSDFAVISAALCVAGDNHVFVGQGIPREQHAQLI
jgi:hypothetical protein